MARPPSQFPTFPVAFTTGDTRDEALANIAEAISLHIEVMREHGEEPPPRSEAAVVEAA